MKYAFLILVAAIVLYAAYQASDPRTRKTASKLFTYHFVRIGGIVLVLLTLMAAAYYLPVSSLTL